MAIFGPNVPLMDSFESSSAKRVAAIANCEKRAAVFAALALRKSRGLNDFTSAAILQGKGEVSKAWMKSTADFPARRLFQKFSFPRPLGATTPRPVMTTRRRLATRLI